MPCRQCGACCKGIRLQVPLDRVFADARMGNVCAVDILRVWRPITRDQAVALSPLVARMPDGPNCSYWTCTVLREDNTCGAYETRPQTCRDFPYVPGGGLTPYPYSDTCGYYVGVRHA